MVARPPACAVTARGWGERVSPGDHRGAWKDPLFHKCSREEGIKGVRGSKENF